jgi:peptide/nickel transport system substrate-binding protein
LHAHGILKSISQLLHDIQASANLFITSAQALATLAKNAEISAHHAQKEGKGLAIIARECLSLAQRAQLPFRGLSILLRNLQQAAQPIITELRTIIELSSRSQKLLKRSFGSLKTIDEITVSLKKIIARAEEHSALNRHLRADISQGMDVFTQQLLSSSTLLDDISIRCAQITSLGHTLDTLDAILLSIDQYGVTENKKPIYHETRTERHIKKQLKFSFNEYTKTLKQLPMTQDLPLFRGFLATNLARITKQVDALNLSCDELKAYEKDLGLGCTEVIKLLAQIEGFSKETQQLNDRLKNVTENLMDKIKNIKDLIHTASKICSKIKTLSVFAKIEEGRSVVYKKTLSPIVEEFARLQAKTEYTLRTITPQIEQLHRDVQQLEKQTIVTVTKKAKRPDYSKIKIILEDLVRVFEEEKTMMKDMSRLVNKLYRNDELLKTAWRDYKASLSRISTASSPFGKTFEEQRVRSPGIIKSESIIRINLPDDPLTLSPDKKIDVNSHQIICNLSAGLFQFGEGTGVIPGLCEYYSLSEDGTEYTFRIRKGLKFQNGKPLEIEHVKDALIKALEGPNFNFFEMIKGAKTFALTRDATEFGIRIIDRSTIKIELEYPFLPIIANLATNCADPYLAADLPIGMGPFKLITWEHGKRIILRANEYYFEGRPPVDELHFVIDKTEEDSYELFKSGMLSVYLPTGESLKKLRDETPSALSSVPELSVLYLCMNCQKEPFDNKYIRQALACAVDARNLVDRLLKGTAIASKGIFPPSMKISDHKSSEYLYNQQKAQDIMCKAGFKNGLPGMYLLDVSDSPSVIKQAEFVKSNLADIGVKVEINPMPWHNLIEKTFAGESMLSFRGWVSDNGDPDNFMYPLFHSSSRGRTGNTFYFSSPEIDRAIEHARTMRNLHKRRLLYREIEKKVLDESPGVFLYHRLHTVAIQKGILGMKPHPLGLIRAKYACPVSAGSVRLCKWSNNGVRKETSSIAYSRPS